MKIFHGYEEAIGWQERPVLALGNFDGVHLGHLHLFEQAKRLAQKFDAGFSVLTFHPHPATIFSDHAPVVLTSLSRKLELLETAGAMATIVQPFTAQFYSLSASAFVEQILVAALHVGGVCVGYDYTFGQGRQGTTERLLAAGEKFGFTTEVVPAFRIDGKICSSSEIRARLAAGDIGGAARFLGRPAELEGEVVAGAGRGRTLGFPTANLRSGMSILAGVYGGIAEVVGTPGKWPVALNVGNRPTFAGQSLAIEAHLIGYSGDLYGKILRIQLFDRIRDEKRFASPEELAAQIQVDVERCRVAATRWLEANQS